MSPAAVEHLSYARFSKRDVPWWGTGESHRERAYDHWLTDDEARAAFPWTVELRPTYYRLDNENFTACPRNQAVTLIHDNPFDPAHQSVLGNVGALYAVSQPEELIEFGSTIVDELEVGKWDTVGSLKDNEVIFATIRLDVVADSVSHSLIGDHHWWLMLTDYFNGQGCKRADIVPVRGVCTNTHQLALKSARCSWSVRHVGNHKSRFEEARRALKLVTKYEEELAKVAEQLAASQFEMDQWNGLIEDLLPVESAKGPRTKTWNEEHQTALTANWLHSPTIDDNWRETKWGALNAVTEWSEWIYDGRKDCRTAAKDRRMLTSLLNGPQAKMRQKAFNFLTR